ncbi:hypothetical protein ACI2K4_14705 [Micromonospora sp. NPDC050397]|uniref:hypothetical protein n=1 Tax=Micromonospora sp. NPDC050397 TaxID=3364279 RepID=UPI00384FB0A7
MRRVSTGTRMHRRLTAALLAVLVAPLALLATGAPAGHQPALVAKAEDAPTDSVMTQHGRPGTYEDFSGLEVTVSQTKNLVSQAITVTWKGGKPTEPVRYFGKNYLQIMQCWGPDPQAPDFRETCLWGVSGANPLDLFSGPDAMHRRVKASFQLSGGTRETDPAEATLPEGVRLPEGAEYPPFRSVHGDRQTWGTSPFGEPAWVPPIENYFDRNTTNELPFGRTALDGTGRATFELQTTTEERDLGCGDPIPQPDGSVKGRPCWLVVVPRGEYDWSGNRLDGVPQGGRVMDGSPLSPSFFANRIVFPLEFEPVGNYCPETTELRQTVGSHLMEDAAASWYGAMCANSTRPPLVLNPMGDVEASQQLRTEVFGAPVGLAYVTDPVVRNESDPPITHAPVTLGAAVITFQIEGRVPSTAPPADQELANVQLRDLKLTPRLVAKLLTQSYSREVVLGAVGERRTYPSLRQDPEFLALNPVFGRFELNFHPAGILVTDGNSALARQVWQWVLADPEARAWLAGAADESGMTVNPNFFPIFADGQAPARFPKADPNCFDSDGPLLPDGPDEGEEPDGGTAPERCAQHISPYVDTLRKAASQTLRGQSGAQNWVINGDCPPGQKDCWKSDPPQAVGQRFMLAITDAASATRYALPTAQLRNRAGEFVAPTPDALLTQVSRASEPSAVAGVTQINPRTPVAGGYPLAMLTYAAVNLGLPKEQRIDYARLLRHAATDGQTPGVRLGQLPAGYVPLPQPLRDQALAVAATVENYVAPTPTPTPTEEAATNPPPPQNPPPTGQPTNTPTSGTSPTPSTTASAAPTPTVGTPAPVAQTATTEGRPVGWVRFLLVVVLGLGLVSAVAGPTMLLRGYRRPR